jgi:hypothetical protein
MVVIYFAVRAARHGTPPPVQVSPPTAPLAGVGFLDSPAPVGGPGAPPRETTVHNTVGRADVIHIDSRVDRKPTVEALRQVIADVAPLRIWAAHTSLELPRGATVRRGAANCSMSHALLLQDIAQDRRDFGWALVFEDDAVAAPDVSPSEVAKRILVAIAEAPLTACMVQMGFSMFVPGQHRLGKYTWVGPAAYNTHAYAVRKSAAAWLSQEIKQSLFRLPVDVLYSRVVSSAVFVYGREDRGLIPAPNTALLSATGLFGQQASASDIQGNSDTEQLQERVNKFIMFKLGAWKLLDSVGLWPLPRHLVL